MLGNATARAVRMLPDGVLSGVEVGGSIVDTTKAVLAWLKNEILHPKFGDPRDKTPAPGPAVARAAAKVIAKGADQAVKFAGQVKDDIVTDLKKLAREAWDLAVPPIAIGIGLLLLTQTNMKSLDAAALAAVAYFLLRRSS